MIVIILKIKRNSNLVYPNLATVVIQIIIINRIQNHHVTQIITAEAQIKKLIKPNGASRPTGNNVIEGLITAINN